MIRRTFLPLAIALFALAPLASAEVEVWRLDPVHSNVGFKVRHFMVSWAAANSWTHKSPSGSIGTTSPP
jgi:polyisoprenoid-binding protein YceI